MKTFIFIMMMLPATMATAQSGDPSGGSSSGGNRSWLLSKGAAARESKRFTLQEYLENRDRRALMDMWLSINTPSPYEFVVSGSLQNYKTKINGVEADRSTINGELSAYARFVGISLEHTNNFGEHYNDVTGIFNLRVFGNTIQGSHLTFHYGLRTRIDSNGLYRLNQPFPAATLQVYVMKYFGIQGNYRSFSPITESFYGDTTANELTYGAFIEYGLLRIFGDVYQERQNSKLNNVNTEIIREGARLGIKLYF